jgi:hypothetical protein
MPGFDRLPLSCYIPFVAVVLGPVGAGVGLWIADLVHHKMQQQHM